MTRDPKLVAPRFARRHPDWYAVSWEWTVACGQLRHALRNAIVPPMLRILRLFARAN